MINLKIGKILQRKSRKLQAFGGTQPSRGYRVGILQLTSFSLRFSALFIHSTWGFSSFSFDETLIHLYILALKSMGKVIYFANSYFSVTVFYAVHFAVH